MTNTRLVRHEPSREYREYCNACGRKVAALSDRIIVAFGLNDLDWHDDQVEDAKARFMCLCQLHELYHTGRTQWP